LNERHWSVFPMTFSNREMLENKPFFNVDY